MSGSLFSPEWYRVASRRPQLRARVQLLRQTQRGVTWFVLQDEQAEPGSQVYRVNRAGYEFIGRCDGQRSVQQLWDELLVAMPEEAPTQDDLVQLLVALHAQSLIQFDVAPDVESMFRRQDETQRKRRRQGVNPWAFRLALIDPHPLLQRLSPLTPWLFNGAALALWMLGVALAAAAAVGHAEALGAHAALAFKSPGLWFVAWLLYPAIKLVHETAHGLAVQRWGGQVRRAGLTLMMLTPVPFVDASAAEGFRRRHQRAVVSAAGIMAELGLAALAMAVWLLVEPGALRDGALIVMSIGAVSTLAVNGNPLMRFDGYYLLCDLLDLRNLASRSQRWWSGVGCRWVLGSAPPGQPLDPMPGERPWLFFHAPLAWAWRLVIGIVMALWLGSMSMPLGLLMLGCIAWASLLKPAWAALKVVRRLADHEAATFGRRWRVMARSFLAGGVLAALALLPLPFSTLAEGVVWLPERAQVRSASEGFVQRIVARDGSHVKAGDLLLELANDHLGAERAGHLASASELEVSLFDAMAHDPQREPALRERLAASRAAIERLDQQIAQLQVRAQVSGTLVMPRQDDRIGSFSKEGALLGHVLTDDPLTVRLALPQQDATLVQGASPAVQVRLAEFGAARYSATLRQDMPAAVGKLPSAALGDRGGGRIPTDGNDEEGLKTRQAVVLLDLEVAGARSDRIGGRALVRFDHGRSPLAAQLLRHLQQLVLQHFNPAR